jgi:hypothetical protein
MKVLCCCDCATVLRCHVNVADACRCPCDITYGLDLDLPMWSHQHAGALLRETRRRLLHHTKVSDWSLVQNHSDLLEMVTSQPVQNAQLPNEHCYESERIVLKSGHLVYERLGGESFATCCKSSALLSDESFAKRCVVAIALANSVIWLESTSERPEIPSTATSASRADLLASSSVALRRFSTVASSSPVPVKN